MPEQPRRLNSLDLVRGVVMVLMAIDHVRVYSGVPAGGASPGVFFTRWITHFCAPAFVFLAGTGAFFNGRKLGDPSLLARYLLTRGALLVVLELTLIKVSWAFDVDYSHLLLAGVIWMLGWCMILMAALVRFSPKAIGIFGLVVIFLQQLLIPLAAFIPDAARPYTEWFVRFLYAGGQVALQTDGPTINILYVIVPWIGVMAAGYGFGLILLRATEERRRICLRIGLGATALYLLVATVVALVGPAPQNPTPFLLRILNQNKYPASQLFLMMTLGPTIALLPAAERARGWLAVAATTIGRVPLFYYLMHIPVIHAAALITTYIREGALHNERYLTAPYTSVPPEHRWSLALLYLVFAVAIAFLDPLCRWFASVKSRRQESWLRFL